MQDGDKPLQFTAEKYKQMTGFRMPRLYLLTRHEDDEAQDDPSEDDLMTPTFYEENAASPPTGSSLGENDGLIGTSTERQEYFEDLEKAVKASLETDKEKGKCKEERKANLDLHVRMRKVLYLLHQNICLTTFPSSTLYPEDRIITVKNTIINMTVAKEPIPLSRDENNIHFVDGRGF